MVKFCESVDGNDQIFLVWLVMGKRSSWQLAPFRIWFPSLKGTLGSNEWSP